MNSLQVGDRNPHFDYKAIPLGDLPQANSRKLFTSLKHQKAVQEALHIIEARMRDLPTLDELASLSGISRTYFSYLFKEVMGIKLQRYLAEARLNKARNLLSNIDLKIKEIAFEAGFSDPNYFCRTFKKRMGVSPTNWRLGKILPFKTNDSRQRETFDRG